ncbi:MAG: hypothetical protein KKE24_03185 [Candidatus Thermoplasmatota archaeon]|nr:hypothetical protein [Candidatus Thermoplasmatota archaeon]
MTPVPSSAEVASDWGTAELIDDGIGYCTAPSVVVDGNGNGMAVWGQYDGVSTINVMTSRYIADKGWTDASTIEFGSWELLESPAIAADTNGNVTIVWSQNVGPYWIYSSQYRPGMGWSTPEVVQDASSASGVRPSVATDGEDNMIAVWTQFDSYHVNVTASRYVQGEGWGPTEIIGDDYPGNPSYPQIAMDGKGNAVVVWKVWASPIYEAWANEYKIGEGWGTAHLVEDVYDGTAGNPRIAMDEGGNATVVWQELIGTTASLLACRYVAGDGWGEPELVENDDTGHVLAWDVGTDDDGNAITVWSQSDGIRNNIHANRYTPSSGWGTAELIEKNDNNAGTPAISLNDKGGAVAVWTQFDGYRYSVYANLYTTSIGWGEPELIEEFMGQGELPDVASGGAGTTIAIWLQHDGITQRAGVNTYLAPDVTPPALSVDEPISGATTNTPTITVSGTTEPGATLSIGGLIAAVDDLTGAFSMNLALSEGENTIMVTAEDISGNSRSVSITITYENPVPELWTELIALEEDLGRIVADMTIIWSDLNASKDDLETLQASLDELSDGLAAVRDDIQELYVGLDSADDNQSAFDAELEALLISLASISESLNITQDLLDETVDRIGDVENQSSSEGDDISLSGFIMGLIGGILGAAILIGLYVTMIRKNGDKGEEAPPPQT